jgi:hypothetical protein
MFLFIILLFKCKKDDDTPISQIIIHAPIANTPFEVFDTVKILLMVESSLTEVSLRISLLNQNYTPVSNFNPLVISNFKTGVETSLNFLLDSYYLESNNYYLYAKVTDATGDAKAYRGIYIEGIAREFEGFFVVGEFSDTQTKLEKLDTDFTSLDIFNFQGNYAGSDLNCRNKLIFLAGRNSGNLLALNSDSLSLEWEVPIVPNPVQPYFTFTKLIDKVLYAGYYNGEVNGYNFAGNSVFSSQANGQTFPNLVCLTGNIFVVSSTSRSNVFEHWLETFFMPSGTFNSKIKLSVTPVHIKPLDDGNVLVFGNDENENLAVKLFDPVTGLVTDPYQPFQLPNELLTCATSTNQNLTLLGLESGIYLYDYQNNLSLVTNSISPQILKWEDLGQTIWAVDGQEVFVFSTDGQQLSQYIYTHPILNLLLHYNK